jgi:hypothetical protein
MTSETGYRSHFALAHLVYRHGSTETFVDARFQNAANSLVSHRTNQISQQLTLILGTSSRRRMRAYQRKQGVSERPLLGTV